MPVTAGISKFYPPPRLAAPLTILSERCLAPKMQFSMHSTYAPCDISASIPSHKSTCLHWLIANSYLARTRVQSQSLQAPLSRRGAPRDALYVCVLYIFRCLHFSQFCKKIFHYKLLAFVCFVFFAVFDFISLLLLFLFLFRFQSLMSVQWHAVGTMKSP